MKKLVTFILISFGLIVSTYALPPHCKLINIPQEGLVLSGKKPALFFLHSLSRTNLWVTHPGRKGAANAGWASQLQPGNWSTLALDRPHFTLNCIESQPGHEQQVPCAQVLEICQMTKVKFPNDLQGSFWAGENLSLPQLKDKLAKRGFELKK